MQIHDSRLTVKQPSSVTKRRLRRALYAMAMLSPIVFVSAFAIYKCYWQVRWQEAELRAKGEPVTMNELLKSYPEIPDSQNAALKIIEAARLIIEPGDRYGDSCRVPWYSFKYERPGLMDKWSTEELEASEEFLATNRQAFDMLDDALELPLSRYPIRYEPWVGLWNLHWNDIRKLQPAILVRIAFLGESRRIDSIDKALLLPFALAKSLEHEPSNTSQNRRWSLIETGIRGIEHVLNRATLSNSQLQSIQSALPNPGDREGLILALREQRCYVLGYWPSGSPPNAPLYQLSALYDRGDAVNAFTAVIDAQRLPSAERRTQVQKLREEVLSVSTHLHDFYRIHASSAHRIEQSFARMCALVDCATVVLAIEQYASAQNSQLPMTLDELVPDFLNAVPNDEFGGAPLRYRCIDGGYVVYSIGMNRVDDGGTPPMGREYQGDIVFTVGRKKWDQSPQAVWPRRELPPVEFPKWLDDLAPGLKDAVESLPAPNSQAQ